MDKCIILFFYIYNNIKKGFKWLAYGERIAGKLSRLKNVGLKMSV